MGIAVHPLADEWTETYRLRVVEHSRVLLSRPMRHFLADCRADGVRAVLLTGADAMLSPLLYREVSNSGVYWAFRDEHGIFDATTGRQIRAFTELWQPVQDRAQHAPLNIEAARLPMVTFDIYADELATPDTELGSLPELAAASLGGGQFVRTGHDEPLTSEWTPHAITELARAEMPEAMGILSESESGPWSVLNVARTNNGLIQRAHGAVPVHEDFASIDALREWVFPQITELARALVSSHRPRVAFFTGSMVHQRNGDLGYIVGESPFAGPLAVLIGARAVRDLNLDINEISARHDVTVLGPGRVPSVLVRMSGQSDLWHQLRSFAFDLDQERLAVALGLNGKEA